eukprot:g421.t1 g421   contig1:1012873-1014592(-)
MGSESDDEKPRKSSRRSSSDASGSGKSRTATTSTGKKMSKRRATNASYSDMSDVEAGGKTATSKGSSYKNNTKSTKKRASFADNGKNLKDSLTKPPIRFDNSMSGHNREVEVVSNNDDEASRRKYVVRDVSFSGSIIKREMNKSVLSEERGLLALHIAMGKVPQQSNSMNDSDRSGSGRDLRPSKFAAGTGGGDRDTKKASFSDEGGKNNRPKFKRPSFSGGSGRSNNDEIEESIAQSTSKCQMVFQRATSTDNTPNDDDAQDPLRVTLRRKNSRGTVNNDDEQLRSSMTSSSRPGIEKRKSLSSINSSVERNSTERPLLVSSVMKSFAIPGHVQAQQRRSLMSMEDQIYVPPKNRHKSIFQAMTLLAAGRLVDLVLWTYGASFGKVMFFFLTFYVCNIFIWAAVMNAVNLVSGGTCINGENYDELSASERYEFAFELAWSTFTTVGYGAVSPPGDVSGCYAIRLVCAFVAFIGVIFGSTTAAIMYSKLMRLLAQAHVTFSSTLCVQYGIGNEGSTVRFGQLNFRASVALTKLSAVSILSRLS